VEESKKVKVAALSFIILVAAVLVIYFIFIRDTGSPPDETSELVTQEATEPSAEEVTPDASDAVETLSVDLNDSDNLVRELVSQLSSHPDLARFLVTDDVIRTFVAAVDNIANGHSPRQQIDFFQPEGEFQAREGAGAFTLDTAGYARYNKVADVFASLDAPGTARLYRQLTPAVQEAYKDLGYPEDRFEKTLIRAIDELLTVPVIEGDIFLEEKLKSFAFIDEELESMSQAQKHLFRMGPKNIRTIQSKLRELKALL
jgi:hypothetical protein